MKINVGILRGGTSPEYETSIRSGGQAMLHIDREKYRPVDLLVGKDGMIHADGAPIEPKALKSIVDVIFNTLHGGLGEDGTVQKVFDDFKIPHTGSGAEKILNKHFAKNEINEIDGMGVRTPFGVTFSLPKELDDFEEFIMARAKYVFGRISPPWIIKPTLGGSSIDTFIARDFSELYQAIKDVLKNHNHVLVEEYIRGREMTMGLIENFRGEENYFTLPTEIQKDSHILDQEARAAGSFRTIHPRDLDHEKKEMMQDFMVKAKEKLGLKHYFTADFIVTPFGVYVLEIDALPAIDENAILPKSLEAVGSNLSEFLDHAITQALK